MPTTPFAGNPYPANFLPLSYPMKNLILFFLLLSGAASAQDLTVSSVTKITGEMPDYTILHNPTLGKLYDVRIRENRALAMGDFRAYTGKVGGKATWKTVPEGMDVYMHFVAIGEKNYIVFASRDEKAKTRTYFVQQLDAAFNLVGEPMEVGKLKLKQEDWYDQLKAGVSADRKTIVIIMDGEHELGMLAFSPETGPIAQYTFKLAPDRDYRFNQVIVSNDGNIYALGNYVRRKYASNERLSDPFVLAYSLASKKAKTHVIKTGEDSEDVGFTVNFLPGGKVLLNGLYYRNKTKDVGYQAYVIEPAAFEMKKFATASFPEPYRKLTYEKAYDPEYFYVANTALLSNGSIVFTVETGLAKIGSYTSTDYTSPVYVVCLDEAGKERWSTTIEKYQVSPVGDGMMGHVLFSKDNTVYMMYNDHVGNLELTPVQKQKEWVLKKNNTYIATVEIDDAGNSKKLKLFTSNRKQSSSLVRAIRVDRGLYHLIFRKDEEPYSGVIDVTQ